MNDPKYETMTTEELQELLLKDFSGEAELPAETILDICGVLSSRAPSHSDPNTAWERFKKHYCPELFE